MCSPKVLIKREVSCRCGSPAEGEGVYEYFDGRAGNIKSFKYRYQFVRLDVSGIAHKLLYVFEDRITVACGKTGSDTEASYQRNEKREETIIVHRGPFVWAYQ